MLAIVVSLAAVIARRFAQGRHADRYLGSKQVILVSATRLRLPQKVFLYYNVTYIIIYKVVWLFRAMADQDCG
jgi:hypothetical protein